MAEIALTQGKTTLLDDADLPLVAGLPWIARRDGRNWYAVYNKPLGNGKYRQVRMHKLLMNPPDGFEVDHISGDGLDNRRENLRNVPHFVNMQNNHINRAAGKLDDEQLLIQRAAAWS